MLSTIGLQIREFLAIELRETGGFPPCDKYSAALGSTFCSDCGRRAVAHFWKSTGLNASACIEFAGPATARRCKTCALPKVEHLKRAARSDSSSRR